ncbi:MAG: hypothetical protein JW704_08715, partial [Anaerolineaceae bacterium]|nr:hypothetical protein [Anaerolineaceae bacterium]
MILARLTRAAPDPRLRRSVVSRLFAVVGELVQGVVLQIRLGQVSSSVGPPYHSNQLQQEAKENNMDNSKCMKCGSSNLDSGFIRSFAKMAYKSGNKPLDLVFDYFPEEKWPRIQARLCLDCGHL